MMMAPSGSGLRLDGDGCIEDSEVPCLVENTARHIRCWISQSDLMHPPTPRNPDPRSLLLIHIPFVPGPPKNFHG